jgi:hypothetical protein
MELLLIQKTVDPRFTVPHLPYLGFYGQNFGIGIFRKKGTNGEKNLNFFSIHFY